MLNQFLSGAIFMADVVITMLMLRFWRRTQDRLFIFFGAAFGIFGLERLIMLGVQPSAEFAPYVYLIRLCAFAIIIVGIADKNRS